MSSASTFTLQMLTMSPIWSSRSLDTGSRRLWELLIAVWVDRTAETAEEWKVLAVQAPLPRRSLRVATGSRAVKGGGQ